MKEHVNFYECLKEAQDRLRGTVVMYDDKPYYVLAITDHKGDGIFRTYLEPVGRDMKTRQTQTPSMGEVNHNSPGLGSYLDDWLELNPKSGILRKQMNSPRFNKYRPFPLGMCNQTLVGPDGKPLYGGVFYLERQPARPSMHQGLSRNMICEHQVLIGPSRDRKVSPGTNIDMMSPAFYSCVMAEHPTAQVCLAALLDPDTENDAAAFDREFALSRGPIDMIFLAYKRDIIGILPKNDFNYIRLGRKFRHCKEVVEELRLFNDIKVS